MLGAASVFPMKAHRVSQVRGSHRSTTSPARCLLQRLNVLNFDWGVIPVGEHPSPLNNGLFFRVGGDVALLLNVQEVHDVQLVLAVT